MTFVSVMMAARYVHDGGLSSAWGSNSVASTAGPGGVVGRHRDRGVSARTAQAASTAACDATSGFTLVETPSHTTPATKPSPTKMAMASSLRGWRMPLLETPAAPSRTSSWWSRGAGSLVPQTPQ